MPYRNALRDNFQRYMDANDAEMRQYARDYMQRYSPQSMAMDGMYASSDLNAEDIAQDANGNWYIVGSPQDPNYGIQAEQPMERPLPNMPQDDYATGIDALTEREKAIKAALLGE